MRSAGSASHVNTSCKLLLFEHAFDQLACKVVGLRTDNFNFASQRAIEGLGAKRDGVLRHHQARRDGTVRDSYMYSGTGERVAGRTASSSTSTGATRRRGVNAASHAVPSAIIACWPGHWRADRLANLPFH